MVLTRPVTLETPSAEVFLTFVSSAAPQAHRARGTIGEIGAAVPNEAVQPWTENGVRSLGTRKLACDGTQLSNLAWVSLFKTA